MSEFGFMVRWKDKEGVWQYEKGTTSSPRIYDRRSASAARNAKNRGRLRMIEYHKQSPQHYGMPTYGEAEVVPILSIEFGPAL